MYINTYTIHIRILIHNILKLKYQILFKTFTAIRELAHDIENNILLLEFFIPNY